MHITQNFNQGISMNKLKNIILYCSFVGITILSYNSLQAGTPGETLDKGIEKSKEAYEQAKDKVKDTYEDAKIKAKDLYDKSKEKVKEAKEKYNEALDKAKAK